MESFTLMLLGYLAWCLLAFIVARAMKIENANKAVSFVYVVLAAPMVLVDYIKGIGTN